MSEDGLIGKLYSLAKEAAANVNEAKMGGVLKKRSYVKWKQQFSHFEYQEGGGLSYGSTGQQETTEEWDILSILDVIHKIKTKSDYQDALRAIVKLTSVANSQADYWLGRFLQMLGASALEGVSDNALLDASVRFLNELEGNPIVYHSTVWLNGIWLKDEKIEIAEGINFRRPVQSDVESTMNVYFPPMIETLPSAILEFSMRAKDQNEVSKAIAKLILILRLFEVGSVQRIREIQNTRLIRSLGGISYDPYERYGFYKYPISMSDAKRLQEFIQVIGQQIPQTLIEPSSGDVDYLVIAIQRYNDAILKTEITESRISFAVMALEALYLSATERQELSDRLSQRIAKTLSIFGHKPLNVYDEVRRAYDIRSRFVHGSPITKEEHGDLTGLTDKLLKYVRLSIVIAMQVRSKYEKEKFLSNIDKSLLDPSVSEGLSRSIKEACKIT